MSTQRLKTLEAKELSLVDTQKVEKPKNLELEDAPLPGGGTNPYNSTGAPAGKPKAPSATKPAVSKDPKDEWWAKKKSKRF